MKRFFKTLILVATLTLFFAIPVNASTVGLNKDFIITYSKQQIQLKVTGTHKKVKLSSNKQKTVKVNKKGKITALKNGKAVITAKIGKKKYKCNVTVMSKKKIEKKLTKISDNFDNFYSETTDTNSYSSIEDSLIILDRLTKPNKFLNSLQGKKYRAFKTGYRDAVEQLNNIKICFVKMLKYYDNPESFDEFYFYDLYDDYYACLFKLWDAKMAMLYAY